MCVTTCGCDASHEISYEDEVVAKEAADRIANDIVEEMKDGHDADDLDSE